MEETFGKDQRMYRMREDRESRDTYLTAAKPNGSEDPR